MSLSTLKSIYQCKCPRCHQGDMFLRGKLLSSKFSVMNKCCAHCGQAFEPEPGYYFGAMFVSYAINTALFITAWLALSIVHPDYSLTLLLAILGITVLIFVPFIYRISRAIWISIFIKHSSEDFPDSPDRAVRK
ncbi:DUF983 domain-containing protein [Algoriphagus halophytocola]|uniref:DUF983 domain-containing protein n=1 Tax=Algoriphagus halophytocola TaxID=2991499 RepID=A0ABY6MF86_9BACT|nr:DUF983 domain-containing protein [Algoriphagus sp. TR-M5]UZD21097.1 DUF983 domain-containing protein [Algoriphagus sp. TR-M5]